MRGGKGKLGTFVKRNWKRNRTSSIKPVSPIFCHFCASLCLYFYITSLYLILDILWGIEKILVESLINSFHFCFCVQCTFYCIFFYKFLTIHVKYRRFQCAINLMNRRNTSVEKLSSMVNSIFGKNKFISIYRSIL